MMQKKLEEIFFDYIDALATQSWDAAAPYFHERATVVFTEATYYGKNQVAGAIGKTFSMIRDENFKIANLKWNIITGDFASGTFEYIWSGTLQGKRFTNPGRATIVWVCENGSWQIINEHFGPMPK